MAQQAHISWQKVQMNTNDDGPKRSTNNFYYFHN